MSQITIPSGQEKLLGYFEHMSERNLDISKYRIRHLKSDVQNYFGTLR